MRNFQNKADVDRVMGLLGFRNVDEFEDYLFQLMGCVQVPEELWNDEMEKMLSNAHKLSSYPYDMTGEILRKYPGKLFRTQA